MLWPLALAGIRVLARPAASADPAAVPCPPLACKDHQGRTHCPCELPKHGPCEPCAAPSHGGPLACRPPHHTFPFCDTALSVPDRIRDLVARINDTDKPGLLTARGLQALPALGVPAYYWGTNCVHSISDLASCVVDSSNVTRCPTNFPSGPSFAATFDGADGERNRASAAGVRCAGWANGRARLLGPGPEPRT